MQIANHLIHIEFLRIFHHFATTEHYRLCCLKHGGPFVHRLTNFNEAGTIDWDWNFELSYYLLNF